MSVPPSCSLFFQYKFSHFSVFCKIFTKLAVLILCSEFNKNTGKSAYLEAMACISRILRDLNIYSIKFFNMSQS